MKTYVLTVSRNFPTTHKRKGEPTHFFINIDAGIKKHTIRDNYPLWKKRIDDVNAGIAIISLRYWSGKPYCAPQIEHKQFGKGEVGVQKLIVDFPGYYMDELGDNIPTNHLAENDGLSRTDFDEWFKKAQEDDELAIIHFTDMRY